MHQGFFQIQEFCTQSRQFKFDRCLAMGIMQDLGINISFGHQMIKYLRYCILNNELLVIVLAWILTEKDHFNNWTKEFSENLIYFKLFEVLLGGWLRRRASCVVRRQQLLQRSSSPKLLGQFLPNFTGMVLGWSSIRFLKIITPGPKMAPPEGLSVFS